MSSLRMSKFTVLFASSLGLTAAGCGSPSAFSLQFAATLSGSPIACDKTVTGLGTSKQNSVAINDLRFYVSNLQFKNSSGDPVALNLDSNEFQLNAPSGSVALIDLTSNTQGSCMPTAIPSGEGTARTNSTVTGTTLVEDVTAVSFDIGVPQKLMQAMIGANTEESVPSPLNEMYWNWASGYRHFVFNFKVQDGTGNSGDGNVHIGSTNCGPNDGKALSDRDACGFVNTPQFRAAQFNLKTNTVNVDLSALLAGLDYIAPIYDPKTYMVIGMGPGVSCHSAMSQEDCPILFSNIGLNLSSGAASADGNHVFSVK